MEAIIFIGIQGAGKSTFYREYFLNTHIRINLDMLKTRHRESIFFRACLEAKQPFVVDNTNPTIEERSRYITAAKENKFRVIAYYFDSPLSECKRRNNQRSPKQIIPNSGIYATHKKLVIPIWSEGFNAIYSVKTELNYSFKVEEWQREI
ncbi:MAG: ATP-binding protein [Scytonematopsis contorta HA4267-MV1]|jgi:predicted kinase|nr:ATP-binding protein [Scytonematopsis contorta HA4267-MV1]